MFIKLKSQFTQLDEDRQQLRAVLGSMVEGVIAIPRGALFEKDGKRVVYRREGGGFAPVEVTVGRNSVSRVVVEKGLRDGDRIALRDPSRKETTTGAGGSAPGLAEGPK